MRSLLIICVVAMNLGIFKAESQNRLTTNTVQQLTSSANTFGLNFYQILSRTRQQNVVVPTYSTFMAISMAAHGAGGNNEIEMREILQLPENHRDVLIGIEALNNKLRTIARTTSVSLINQMLHADNVAPKSDFKDIARRVFHVEPRGTFSVPPGTINFDNRAWFDCYMRAQNIAYSPIFFDNGTGPLEVAEITRSTGKHRYGELRELDATFVEIPCEDYVETYEADDDDEYPEERESNVRSTSIFIILPNKINGLEKLEKNIGKMSVEKLFSADEHDVNVVFPPMSLSYSEYIEKDLFEMGFQKMFFETSGFSNINDTSSIRVDEFLNFASLDVQEIPDSASTLFDNSEKSIDFTVNRPFVIVVTTNDEDPLILMIARYTVFKDLYSP